MLSYCCDIREVKPGHGEGFILYLTTLFFHHNLNSLRTKNIICAQRSYYVIRDCRCGKTPDSRPYVLYKQIKSSCSQSELKAVKHVM